MLRLLSILLLFSPALFAAEASEVDVERLSEASGHLIGKGLSVPGFSFDVEALVRGIRGALGGKESPMSEEEFEQALGLVQERVFEQMAADNLVQASAYLKENASKPSIVEIEPDKLQYRVEKEGVGRRVAENTTCKIHYTGRYLDGTVFGTSLDGEAIDLPLDQSIPGFSRGIAGMREGEKRTLFVHPELGYGTTGHLQPNSLLIFEVEVMEASSLAFADD